MTNVLQIHTSQSKLDRASVRQEILATQVIKFLMVKSPVSLQT